MPNIETILHKNIFNLIGARGYDALGLNRKSVNVAIVNVFNSTYYILLNTTNLPIVVTSDDKTYDVNKGFISKSPIKNVKQLCVIDEITTVNSDNTVFYKDLDITYFNQEYIDSYFNSEFLVEPTLELPYLFKMPVDSTYIHLLDTSELNVIGVHVDNMLHKLRYATLFENHIYSNDKLLSQAFVNRLKCTVDPIYALKVKQKQIKITEILNRFTPQYNKCKDLKVLEDFEIALTEVLLKFQSNCSKSF